MQNVPVKIIVHHTAVSGNADQFNGVNASHKERDFPLSSLGFYVGYHYLIEKSGTIRQARLDHEQGAHATEENTSSIGIALAGNFDIEFPTDAQISSLGMMLSNLCGFHGIDREQIFPHRNFANKSCYGSRLADDWAMWVQRHYQNTLILNRAHDVCEQSSKRVYQSE